MESSTFQDLGYQCFFCLESAYLISLKTFRNCIPFASFQCRHCAEGPRESLSRVRLPGAPQSLSPKVPWPLTPSPQTSILQVISLLTNILSISRSLVCLHPLPPSSLLTRFFIHTRSFFLGSLAPIPQCLGYPFPQSPLNLSSLPKPSLATFHQHSVLSALSAPVPKALSSHQPQPVTAHPQPLGQP